jgi:hypothetical protein
MKVASEEELGFSLASPKANSRNKPAISGAMRTSKNTVLQNEPNVRRETGKE